MRFDPIGFDFDLTCRRTIIENPPKYFAVAGDGVRLPYPRAAAPPPLHHLHHAQAGSRPHPERERRRVGKRGLRAGWHVQRQRRPCRTRGGTGEGGVINL